MPDIADRLLRVGLAFQQLNCQLLRADGELIRMWWHSHRAAAGRGRSSRAVAGDGRWRRGQALTLRWLWVR